MGSAMVQCRINGPATSGIDGKIKMVNNLNHLILIVFRV